MNIIFSLITKSQLLKYAFGYSFTISSLSFLEQEFTEKDYFTSILKAVPSKVAMALGILYGIVILLGKISIEWKKHKINLLDIKKAKELVEQQQIRTEKQRNDVTQTDK